MIGVSKIKYWRVPLDHDAAEPAHGHVHVIKDRCKGCGFCIGFCPRKVLSESAEFNRKGYHPAYAAEESKCLACGLCEAICPEFAVSVTPANAEGKTHD